MARKQVTLIFPQHLIKEPVIYMMAKEHDVVPNIRRARVTESMGEVTQEPLAGQLGEAARIKPTLASFEAELAAQLAGEPTRHR